MGRLQHVIDSGPKDMLQAMFEFIKLAAKASEWHEEFRAIERRDYELRLQGKEFGWEPGYREELLMSAYERFKKMQEAQPTEIDRFNITGWVYMYETTNTKPASEE